MRFRAFFSTKDKGTGLGLATVYGIVKQSKGHISVYIEPGRGTTFKVYLPSIEQIEDVTPLEELIAPIEGGTETVLLVEDEDMVRELAKDILERHGYTVLPASHGEEALNIVRKYSGSIDIIVTDLVMP